ncbi:MAG: prephenate dehydratase [Geminicoccaceae bacterium]
MTPIDTSRIAFQGKPGAYSHLACLEAYPQHEPVPCATFDDAFAMVREQRCDLAMIPIENSVAGRVADNHYLLPDGGLHIVAEHFQRVNHMLLAPHGATLDGLKRVHSHTQALGQCRDMIRKLGLQALDHADTAGAAAEVGERADTHDAAIASKLAADTYGLDILLESIEDAPHNTTRFVVLARNPAWPQPDDRPCITTFVFRVRNLPAALYKALGGFATNGINMLKLESYVDASFAQAQFYADIEGHPNDAAVDRAMAELRFFTENPPRVLGVYKASPFRASINGRLG